MSSGWRRSGRNMDAQALVADGLLTVGQAADFLRVGRSTIYALLAAGEIPHVKIGRATRLPRAAVVAFAAARLTGATQVSGDVD
jgi:excisionase family DNA binding protein